MSGGKEAADKKRELAMRRFLVIGLRLSIVIAVVAATIQLFQTYTTGLEQDRRTREIWTALECAANVPAARLQQHVNLYGNIDIGKVGCAVGQFWASPEEIEKARRGDKSVLKGLGSEFFDPAAAARKAFEAFMAVNLISLLLVGLWTVTRWVIWGRPT